ncbi:hypothetical protein [Actinopolyspora lacussalsi]|uniref:hypothetical protein n=1 Tax=Actinopolyspora righensis TaxID=995060 RepID=UPI0011138284|nr:hypothetical protein [Actinopolyspora righensis]
MSARVPVSRDTGNSRSASVVLSPLPGSKKRHERWGPSVLPEDRPDGRLLQHRPTGTTDMTAATVHPLLTPTVR